MGRLLVAIVVTGVLALGTRPAQAECRSHCSPAARAIAYTLAAGYAAGTGYFIVRDLTDERQTLGYGGAELGVNLVATGLFLGATVDAAGDPDGHPIVFGALAAVHAGL